MIYHLKNKNYCTFDIFEKNKLPARAYFIPFSNKQEALQYDVTEARYHSDLVACLSGEWDFRFYRDPKTLEDDFDSDKLVFDKVKVPSVWQYTGYLDPAYINCNYPFKFDPPRIPEDEDMGNFKESYNNAVRHNAKGQFNSIGVYRKKFCINELSGKTYTVAFLGVVACLDFYVNGKFVGYSEGAHNTAEFCLDEFLAEGENELIAVVRRFSTGTYLEAQDMFRNSGIFRDVLLYGTEKEHIDDYEIKTFFKENGKYDLKVSVFVKNSASGEVSVEFNGKTYEKKCDAGKATFEFVDLEVKEWSAELPRLYTVTIGLDGREYAVEKIGFRHIEIKGDTFYLNGKKIKLFGVNHHDTHPVKGYAMSMEDIEKDILLMKEYNVNAVRTSHYPPDPAFVRLCDKYGLYVIDEADIETHGACVCGNVGKLSNDPNWKEHYLDRVKRMYFRDRNSCSVTMWSLGNESGGIYCHQYCNDYLKTVTDIPVHYEGACREKIIGFDVVSEMYTSIEHMKRRAASRTVDKRRNKPYFLCEYCHAMGLGPGALADYIELFLSEDVYLGGCIWEWADHSVYHPENGNYTYGGDHNEYKHDGNFCIDGLFRPDRMPYTSAYLMKAAYRPVRAKYLGEGKVEFYNVNRFRSTDYLTVLATPCVGGALGKEKEIKLSLEPTERTTIVFDRNEGQDSFINIKYVEKETGRTVAEEQVVLSEAIPEVVLQGGKPQLEKKGKFVTVRCENGFSVTFDLSTAGISSYNVSGKEVVKTDPQNRLGIAGIYTELYRAPSDNDKNFSKLWRLKGLDRFKVCRPCFKITETEKGVTVKFTYLLRNCIFPIAKVTDVYTVHADGKILVETSCRMLGRVFMFPRMGKALELGQEFDNVRYYGRGERENYPDMKEHTKIGVYEQKGNFATKMIVPQMGGERCDVRWAEITDQAGVGIRIDANKRAFMLNVNHFSEADITKWKHIIDYRDGSSTYVNIDGFMCGIGSNSCGPIPEKKYRLSSGKPLRYSFAITPIFPFDK